MCALLEIKGLKKHFPITRGVILKKTHGWVRAVDGIDLSVLEAQTLGLVGESGSGKTTTGKLILGLLKPTAGRILFEGGDLASARRRELKERRRKISVIFQDPVSSFDPRKTAFDIIEEPMRIQQALNRRENEERVAELIEEVGLGTEHLKRYPHEFSGGQLQRIGIARALALNPKLVVADEPTSALDVSVQAQILNLMRDLQERLMLSYLFISHDLCVVRHIAQKVAVMYLGRVLELATARDLFDDPQHPYTEALLDAVPDTNPSKMKEKMKRILKGETPSAINPPKGCRFNPRCPSAKTGCSEVEPELRDVGKGHYVACYLR